MQTNDIYQDKFNRFVKVLKVRNDDIIMSNAYHTKAMAERISTDDRILQIGRIVKKEHFDNFYTSLEPVFTEQIIIKTVDLPKEVPVSIDKGTLLEPPTQLPESTKIIKKKTIRSKKTK